MMYYLKYGIFYIIIFITVYLIDYQSYTNCIFRCTGATNKKTPLKPQGGRKENSTFCRLWACSLN